MILTTYNLWHGLNAKGTLFFEGLEPEARTALRYEEQLKLFQSFKTDVFFFQELNPLRERMQSIADLGFDVFGHGDNVGLKLLGVGLPWNLESGIGIAVRKPCLAHLHSTLKLSGRFGTVDSPMFSLQTSENRYAVLVDWYHEPVGHILLVGAHLHHGPEWTDELAVQLMDWSARHDVTKAHLKEVEARLRKGDERRKAELDLLLGALKPLQSRYQAIILAGDLNLSPDSARYQQIVDWGFMDAAADRDDLVTFDGRTNQNHLLTKTFELPVKAPQGLSQAASDNLMSLLSHYDQRPRRIDYVFVFSENHGLKAKAVQLVKAPESAPVELSDHYGLAVTLEQKR